jgi:hypothetical protein
LTCHPRATEQKNSLSSSASTTAVDGEYNSPGATSFRDSPDRNTVSDVLKQSTDRMKSCED